MTQFNLVAKLISENEKDITYSFSDTSLFKKEGMYYLFTSVFRNNKYELKMFYSNRLFGPYNYYGENPLIADNISGRMGG